MNGADGTPPHFAQGPTMTAEQERGAVSELVEKVGHRLYDALRPETAPPYWLCERAAQAAIAAVLDTVEAHLTAVQYDPAPYTALKHRLAHLRREALG